MRIFFPTIVIAAAAPWVPAQADVVAERFKGYDTNADGVLAGEEMNGAAILKRLDLNRDGTLTLPEALEAVAKRRASSAERGHDPGLFQRLDKDGDGKLTQTELPRREWFKQLDADGSGDITLEEAQATITKLRRSGQILPPSVPVIPAEEDKAFTASPKLLKPAEHGVGRLVPDLLLRDVSGTARNLSARLEGKRGLLIAFFGASCPISRKYGPELARLEELTAKLDVEMLLVCPVKLETEAEMQEYLRIYGLKSPVIHDRDGSLSSALQAVTTAESFLMDGARTLVYRGAINDRYGLDYSKEAPTKNYLRDALHNMVDQHKVTVAATTAPGCALDVEAVPQAVANPITYHNQVSRILQANCVECHRTGGAGPFSLETYEDVLKNAGMIRKQVERGAMPPWFAAPLEGQPHSPWLNDSSLASRDKEELLTWLASDRPAGDPKEAPQPRNFVDGWALGAPDAVVQLPKPIAVKAEGTMPYQFVKVPTAFPEDRWVQAYEIVPTDPRVVHHVIVQVHPKGAKVRDRGEGAGGYWAAYVPGNASHRYAEGFAKKLPAGATLSFQIHYTPNGRATTDQLKLGLTFAKAPPRYAVHTAAVVNTRINIPSGAANHVEVAERTLPADVNITAYMAHMHVRGKAFKFEVTPPGGETEVLLDLPRYDFNWQLRYEYAQPKFLPRGSRVRITAVFDNSEDNPANPDATKNVRWGEQTYDEMMIGYFEYYTPVSEEMADL